MNQHDIEHVREIARSLAQRALFEQEFRERIQEEPVATLTAAGLPEEFVATFLQETQLGDVFAYGMDQQCLISDIGSLQDFIY